jgi:photosystem II stability/assembly factor-like uncharacterized protein
MRKFNFLFLLSLIAHGWVFAQNQLDAKIFGDIRARHIGPSVMSGRVACLDAINKKQGVLYVGTAGGGIWKTLDFGVTYKPVFDKHNQSIGAICIDQSHPDTIWAGTGEPWTRNSVSVGDGIYKSTDGGENWKKLGLEKTERISKIYIHPKDNNTVYVAAPGALWSDSEERGLYKTTDGGATWKKILYINPQTGISDLAVDPTNPEIIYASAWEFRRKAYSFNSGGKNSGIYKSVDGGATWKKLSNGIPTGNLGRIDLAVSPADANVVYATIESKETAMYRSNDKGETWTKTGTHNYIIERPFYFAKLIADPKDPNRIYRAGLSMLVSTDGGKSFTAFRGGAHGDYHDVWINPNNTDNIVVGTDGGVYTSYDRGSHFLQHKNLPIGQFYHVAFDNEENYNVYGGLQDNGSWMGPSRTLTGSINNRNWSTVGWGDGFWVVPDPADNNFVYSESQGGELQRYNKTTKTAKSIKPLEMAGQPRYRYNWNSPIGTSPTNKNKLYYGAQYLFVSNNKGDSWEKISPDLTTNDPAKQKQEDSGGLTSDNSSAENHCTIYTISESPLNEKVIWVGTDDGNVQLTKDGGKTWSNLVKNIKELPAFAWVSTIEASRFNEGTAYVTFDNHTQGDMNAYVYKTTDYGVTWTRIGTNIIKGYCHVVKEDIKNKNLLFVGSEFGLFISLDGGVNWAQLDHNNNVPNVAVRDIAIHPTTNDLILATHGRGIMIIDDITPIRLLTDEVINSKFYAFPLKPFFYPEFGFDAISFGDDESGFVNPKSGFMLTYYLQKKHMNGDFYVEVLDDKKQLLSTKIASKRKGINMLEIDLQIKAPKMPTGPSPAYAGFVGAPLKAGNYQLKVVKETDTTYIPFTIINNPKSQHSASDKDGRHELMMKLYKQCNDFTYTVNSHVELQSKLKALEKEFTSNEKVKKMLIEYGDKLEAQRKLVVNTKEGMINDGNNYLRDKLSNVYIQVVSYDGKPSATQFEKSTSFEKDINDNLNAYTAIDAKYMAGLNAAIKAAGKSEIALMSRSEFDKMK